MQVWFSFKYYYTSSNNLGPTGPVSRRRFPASCFSKLASYSQVVYFLLVHSAGLHIHALIQNVISPVFVGTRRCDGVQ
jgi:hypothetical protein